MANIHTYFGIENLAMSNAQRNQFLSALQALGARNDSVQPAERNHWRISNDNNAAIFEAVFDEDSISVDGFKGFLANVFGINPTTIDNRSTQTAYGRLVTLSRNSTDYLRIISFGFDGGFPTWQQSNEVVRSYLANNSEVWESE